ncbi:unnamed protein product [Prunus armeniaca]|uniref:Uncharacterized protein n=1 Tax=Prunus armeniaca TaxID=36596 RepID=A0A6J5YA54_PRUAR|nr:unnamed protein product [Prunus armeniaca]CAB4321283.1 unnamed protein product [Prunus armeniaca]
MMYLGWHRVLWEEGGKKVVWSRADLSRPRVRLDAVMSATAALTSQLPFHNDANQPTEISRQLGSQIRGPSASL